MSRAAEKLRAERIVARGLQVFITTNYTLELTLHAKTCLERVYRKGPAYKKAGVMLYELTAEEPEQGHLFEERSPDERAAGGADMSGF